MGFFSTALLSALLASPSFAAYTLRRNHAGNNFTSAFEFRQASDYEFGDPTRGFVNYVNEATARSKGLVKVVNNQVYLGADFSTKVATTAQGRDSIRLEAKEAFTNGLLIADIAHMPGSVCGIWPAFWTFNFDENPYGEIDIIEGVSNQPRNVVSFHTCGTCSFSFTDQERPTSCNLGNEANGCADDDNANMNYWGCGDTAPANSFGTPFNNVQGGVYATEITNTFVKIWFFPRANIPADIKNGNPNPANWPAPFINAQQSQKGCDVKKYFKNQKVIINTDFCGSNISQEDWDRDTTCKAKAATCAAYVGGNPAAFSEAYWLFNSLKLYQQ
ncbi:Concanavalin A-like lectin/glucanase domain containing protein [Rhypophila decipiens]